MYNVIFKGTLESKVVSRKECIELHKQGKLFHYKRIGQRRYKRMKQLYLRLTYKLSLIFNYEVYELPSNLK